jgi:hypothetical protein
MSYYNCICRTDSVQSEIRNGYFIATVGNVAPCSVKSGIAEPLCILLARCRRYDFHLHGVVISDMPTSNRAYKL